jgi:hypothetical protein
MRVVGAVLCLVGACGFTPGVANNGGDDGGMNRPDGPVQVDAAVVPIDGPNCYGKGLLQVCFDDALPGTFTAPPSGTLATDTDANCTKVFTQPSGRELCVVAAQTIDVAVDLRAIGNRPLVLIGATTLHVDAGVTIDVATRDGSNTGAGGNDTACGVPGTPDNDAGGGGGAAGGSFIGKGGDGGEGDSNMSTSVDGVASPSTATPAVTTTIVRGGCRGGIGGGSSPGAMGKTGGSGGGAVYLIAGSTLMIDGTIDAGGAGGQATDDEQGGPGGGSGGMIGLDAPAIMIAGGVFANGGGGAEGGATNSTGAGGMAGDNGQHSETAAAAGGDHTYNGSTPSQGGRGGDGSVGGQHGGSTGATDLGGGGGGGGGAGFIYTQGTVTSTGQISPS